MESTQRSRSISSTPQKALQSEYEREFQPFYKPIHTQLAPYNRFSQDEKCRTLTWNPVDEDVKVKLKIGSTMEGQDKCLFSKSLRLRPRKMSRLPVRIETVKYIMEEIEGTTSHPIDLTRSQTKKRMTNPLHLLAKVPMKSIKFAEDVRPPYVGTFTRLYDTESISQVARNPFSRHIPKINYDYDSEAEWEEPLEGEDLDSEGEEDGDDEEDSEEMTGFLDDEGAMVTARGVNRRPVLGDQEPTCTGICWEGPQGSIVDQGLAALDWRLLKLDVLMGKQPEQMSSRAKPNITDNPQLPIDPYCSTYWAPTTSSTSLQTTPHSQSTLMEPPRLPLLPVNRYNAQTRIPTSLKSDLPSPMKPAKTQRLVTPELMDDFLAAVHGNDLTKVGLLEILKKKYDPLMILRAEGSS